MKELDELKEKGEAPDWMTPSGYKTMSKGYLLEGETPKKAYKRVAKAVSGRLNKPNLSKKFFKYMWKGWLGLASPVLSNTGTERGLPISCYSLHPGDSIDSIFSKAHELACLSKGGGGVGIFLGDLRHRGALIREGQNGKSDGIVPWAKVYDSTTVSVSQGSTRRGASAFYLDVEHPDFEEFLRIRRPQGDVNRQCLNSHHAVCLSDEFMESLAAGNKENRRKWQEILRTRVETGEPYLFFTDNVNRGNPQCYKDLGLSVKGSNICSEIALHTDPEHTFVCCLSSVNLAKWEEWKNTDLVYDAVWFLDGVLEEFIARAKKLPGLESAVRFAEKSRAVGLGVFGFHSLLQDKSLSYGDLQSRMLNRQIFKQIRQQTDKATSKLAEEYGEPEWCKGYGRRNTHTIAVAPTVTNSKLVGHVSAGIEPWPANVFVDKSAKGTFIVKNKILERELEKLGMNDAPTWKKIANAAGSVQGLEIPEEIKKIFQTAKEINQFDLITLAADRQEFIDQSQSLNLFFPVNASAKYIHEVHYKAWELGLKTLYYYRAESVLKGDRGDREYQREATCLACDG